MRVLVLEAAYFKDLHAECLQPGEESLEGRLILEGAVHHGFHWLHGCAESLEVK